MLVNYESEIWRKELSLAVHKNTCCYKSLQPNLVAQEGRLCVSIGLPWTPLQRAAGGDGNGGNTQVCTRLASRATRRGTNTGLGVHREQCMESIKKDETELYH